jgi:hypothetical protein
MKKEKTISWRRVHSPLLYDAARHLEGPPKYWDIVVKDGGAIERLKAFWGIEQTQVSQVLEIDGGYGFKELEKAKSVVGAEGVVILRNLQKEHCVTDDHWNVTLRWGSVLLLFHRPESRGQHVILNKGLRFFNSKNY